MLLKISFCEIWISRTGGISDAKEITFAFVMFTSFGLQLPFCNNYIKLYPRFQYIYSSFIQFNFNVVVVIQTMFSVGIRQRLTRKQKLVCSCHFGWEIMTYPHVETFYTETGKWPFWQMLLTYWIILLSDTIKKDYN